MDKNVVRDDAIYVTRATRRALIKVAVAFDLPGREVELVEEILNHWLLANHSDVVAHLKLMWDQDKAFDKALAEKLGPKQRSKEDDLPI